MSLEIESNPNMHLISKKLIMHPNQGFSKKKKRPQPRLWRQMRNCIGIIRFETQFFHNIKGMFGLT